MDRYKRQTKRYRDHLQIACRASSLSWVSRKEGIGYKQLERLYYQHSQAYAQERQGQKLPQVIGVDEFSGKRRVRMHVSINDLSDKPKLWDVMEAKKAEDFIAFFNRYSKEERSEVLAVVHDMDRGFESWTRLMFPRAFHIIDKFHVVRTLLKHLERVRKSAYQKSGNPANQRLIRSSYFLIKRRRDKLSEEQEKKLKELLTLSKHLTKAYEMKETFCRWYDTPKRRWEAETELIPLEEALKQIPYLKRFLWVLKYWREGILNFFMLSYSNGFTEGMHNKIKTLKRQAYGFKSFEHFRARILNECSAASTSYETRASSQPKIDQNEESKTDNQERS